LTFGETDLDFPHKGKIERRKGQMALELYRRRHPAYWRPTFGLGGLREEMNGMFSDLLEDTSGRGGHSIIPAVDLIDDKDSVRVNVELPGMKMEDVDITLKEDLLTIRGEKKEEKEEKDESRYYMERSYGSFSRTISLPSKVKADEVKATYTDGVLRIDLPKAEEEKVHQVNVEVQ
jgi:HSP20 family protein